MGFPRAVDKTPYATKPERPLGQARILRVDDGSAALNVDGRTAGVPVVMWNGTGAADTGGDWTRGGDAGQSETAAAMHSGTNGLDTGVRSEGDETTFDNGADTDIVGTYGSLSFWMNPQAFPSGAELEVRWKKASGDEHGQKLQVEDYVTDFDLDVWQEVTIPIFDFGLTADVALLELSFSDEAGQHFYFDDIELVPSGGAGPYIFRVVAPDATVRYHLSLISFVMSGAASGWNGTTFGNVPALDTGLVLRQRNIVTGITAWSINSKDNIDLFGRFHPAESITFADGTMLVSFMVKPSLASIVLTDQEAIEYVVRDNLSGLANARAFAHYAMETVP